MPAKAASSPASPMQTPSPASRLLQGLALTISIGTPMIPCRSWLASEGGLKPCIAHADAFASKPAPTQGSAFFTNHQQSSWHFQIDAQRLGKRFHQRTAHGGSPPAAMSPAGGSRSITMADSTVWPKGYRCAVVLTVDYNDVHGILTQAPEVAGRDNLRRYPGARGTARQLLRRTEPRCPRRGLESGNLRLPAAALPCAYHVLCLERADGHGRVPVFHEWASGRHTSEIMN